MRNRILLLIFIVSMIVLMAWKLRQNKETIDQNAELSQVKSAFIPVETMEPSIQALGSKMEADGIFMPFKEMFIISETAGRVLDVFKNRGDVVKEGELIGKVDDELLRLQLQTVEANIEKGKKDKERLTNLIEGEAVAKNKIEDVELALLTAEMTKRTLEKQISNTSIKAPMSGVLTFRIIERGGVIAPGIQIGQITNIEKLLLFVKVTEKDILSIKKGQPVEVVVDVYPNKKFTARVTNLGVKADNAFNYDVEIEVDNSAAFPLRAGMHAKAAFSFSENRRGMVIDRKAVVGSVQDAKVFVVRDSVAVLRSVSLGLSQGNLVEVVSGLKPGEKVVVSGQINLSEGTRVQIIGEKSEQ